MATEKSALRITELDFDTIRENLKTFLQSQDEFTDFDFEGSGMAVLLDILAYNTHYMAYQLNMVGNEMFLDSAQLRSSILSHAKSLTYIPESKKGALAELDVQITPSLTEDNDVTTITLEKYTKLLGSDIDGVNYPFVALYTNTATKSSGSFLFSNVFIKQGEVQTLQFLTTSTNTKRRYEIPSANVDTDTILVTVQESTSNVDTKTYTLADDITEITANSQVYFIEENENLNYTIYFGDDVIGKRPKDGSVVICTYLDTVGSPANNISKFTFIEEIDGFRDNVIVTVNESSYSGVDKETIEQVRFRAPYYYTAQNRAVTTNDYETLLIKDFNNISAVSVWGGEDNDPVIYGKVYMSLKTRGNYYLTEFEKERIKNYLIANRNVLTVTPEIVDPNYVYMIIKAKVYYDQRLTSRTSTQIEELVRASILDYNDADLNTFNSTFRKSKLQTYIENSEQSITGSDVNVFVQSRVDITPDILDTYTFDFGTALSKGEYNRKISSFPEITVYDLSGTQRDVFFEEVPESLTGIRSIDVISAGSGYTSTPSVIITGDGSGATATAKIINGKLNSITVDNKGSNYTRATVTLSGGGSSSEATAEARIENVFGTIRSYYYKTNGEKVIVNSEAGTIDYVNGKIVVRELLPLEILANDYYTADVLTINAPPLNQVIPPLRNRILTIDENVSTSIVIEMVPE